jgi:DNA invertase Pin-like site-specific DNA recombinase
MTAAVYIRKSRKDADKPSHRLTVQREHLPAYAKAQGWQVEIYDDGHASAARGKTEDLRERARLEDDIRASRIDIILTIELSRLSRDDSLQDYVAWLHLCGEHGVKLATMSRILDPAQHSDWMLLLMEGGFSSVEMKVLQAE